MKMEHIAINVNEPIAMADWYKRNLGMAVVRSMNTAPYTHFLRDSSSTMMIEIYNNPKDNVPDYEDMGPLELHIAFVSDDPNADMQNLIEEGASLEKNEHLENGSHLIMMRDPWGLCIQLCKRAESLISGN